MSFFQDLMGGGFGGLLPATAGQGLDNSMFGSLINNGTFTGYAGHSPFSQGIGANQEYSAPIGPTIPGSPMTNGQSGPSDPRINGLQSTMNPNIPAVGAPLPAPGTGSGMGALGLAGMMKDLQPPSPPTQQQPVSFPAIAPFQPTPRFQGQQTPIRNNQPAGATNPIMMQLMQNPQLMQQLMQKMGH